MRLSCFLLGLYVCSGFAATAQPQLAPTIHASTSLRPYIAPEDLLSQQSAAARRELRPADTTGAIALPNAVLPSDSLLTRKRNQRSAGKAATTATKQRLAAERKAGREVMKRHKAQRKATR